MQLCEMPKKKKSVKGTSEKKLLELVTHNQFQKILTLYTPITEMCFVQEEQCRAFFNEAKGSEQPS